MTVVHTRICSGSMNAVNNGACDALTRLRLGASLFWLPHTPLPCPEEPANALIVMRHCSVNVSQRYSLVQGLGEACAGGLRIACSTSPLGAPSPLADWVRDKGDLARICLSPGAPPAPSHQARTACSSSGRLVTMVAGGRVRRWRGWDTRAKGCAMQDAPAASGPEASAG
jgi:hypothetical protein